MIWFVAGIGALLLVLLIGQWFAKADPKMLAVNVRRFGGLVLLVISAVIGFRGNLALAGPAALIGWMLLMGRPIRLFGNTFGGWSGGGGRPSSGQSSTVDTDTIRMSLDHDTGEMDGEVRKGRFAGRRLSKLGFDDLLELLDECRAGDPGAAQLLEAYLDRAHPDAWQARREKAEGRDESASSKSAPRGEMSVEEAYATLGLQPGATRDDIKQAHRRLMKKLHPDQGGSTYLASKINQAKDVLLKSL